MDTGPDPTRTSKIPLGCEGAEQMEWAFHTHVGEKMNGHGEGEAGVDNRIAERGFTGIGAWILGLNMFGPVRGQWLDESWQGWWGGEPPYHTPAFALTHHARPSLKMAGALSSLTSSSTKVRNEVAGRDCAHCHRARS
jgi:dihydrofolate reductase